ncbi:MAG: hypothetical protein JWR19_439 [Pedosphaera sp.]|nr:hypothetical protein [Pedosphaera sp.]
MNNTYEIVRGTIILVLGIAAVGWIMWRWLKGSRDPGGLIFRWVVTAVVIILFILFGGRAMVAGGYTAMAGVLAAAVCGIVLAILWVPSIVDVVGRKFGSLFDGGDEEVDPKPYYSIFHAQRSKGNYQGALAEVRKQLEKFPMDFEGQMLLAALQAENLNDLPGAEITVQRFCNQPGHAPLNISYALNRLADWQLQLARDREAARQALEQIVTLLPDTEMALQAAQRIGRLAGTEVLLEPHTRRRMTLEKGAENIGLRREQDSLKQREVDPAETAAEYVKHLEQHPLDGHIRESLAVLYANHYQRLDMATDQLEQLIQQPNQPGKEVVRWLNLLADLQVQQGAEVELVRGTLERIVEGYPDGAAAENARRRLDILGLEMRAKQNKSQAVPLGSYEQNIGLKRRA